MIVFPAISSRSMRERRSARGISKRNLWLPHIKFYRKGSSKSWEYWKRIVHWPRDFGMGKIAGIPSLSWSQAERTKLGSMFVNRIMSKYWNSWRSYDLQHLIQEETASWNPFDKILAKIHQYGDVLALGVIIWIGFRVIIDTEIQNRRYRNGTKSSGRKSKRKRKWLNWHKDLVIRFIIWNFYLIIFTWLFLLTWSKLVKIMGEL